MNNYMLLNILVCFLQKWICKQNSKVLFDPAFWVWGWRGKINTHEQSATLSTGRRQPPAGSSQVNSTRLAVCYPPPPLVFLLFFFMVHPNISIASDSLQILWLSFHTSRIFTTLKLGCNLPSRNRQNDTPIYSWCCFRSDDVEGRFMKYGSQGPAQTQCDRVWVVQPGHLLSLNTLLVIPMYPGHASQGAANLKSYLWQSGETLANDADPVCPQNNLLISNSFSLVPTIVRH